MVISNDIETIKYTAVKGVKYFELYAQKVQREILPGLFINAWGYNGSTPGPTIIVDPGDEVVLRVYNELDSPTSVHWHGLNVLNIMDGVPDIEPSPKIQPGSYFNYRFKIINPPGTHMYHTHFMAHMQSMMGLGGGFVISDQNYKRRADKDFFYMLQDTLFIADNPGIWQYHCHIPHHMTNNMSDPGGMLTTVVYKI